jgi:glycosyltransferase involved in cell wall biosynthesis
MLRVLHGPVNVGNQPWVLSRHERQLGVHSDLVVNYSTWFGYPADRCLSPLGQRSVRNTARRLWFGLTSPWRYDVFHYYFGRSFLCWDDYAAPNRLWFADLKLAKRLGRKVFMTLQGCDARLSDASAARNRFTACQIGRCESAPDCRATLDARRRDLINNILPLADRVFFLNPELGHFVPGATFMPYCSVDVEAFEPVWPKTTGLPVLMHAPSNESIKGSAIIIEAVARLKKRIPLEFVLVKGVPYQEALKLYQRADLIIDQLLVGWYGGFAVEAMAMGKPVACYIRGEDLGFLPAGMREDLPLVQITPETIEADLEAALLRRSQWPSWGRRARAYVLRWHHPRRLAAAMLRAYRDPQSNFTLEAEDRACAA